MTEWMELEDTEEIALIGLHTWLQNGKKNEKKKKDKKKVKEFQILSKEWNVMIFGIH